MYMFCWRPRSIYFLGSLSKDVQVFLIYFSLGLGGEESAPY